MNAATPPTNATVSITTLGQRGEGVAELEGRRVYVPLTVPGDVAEIAVAGDRGTLLSLVKPSAERIDPFCPHFGPCGGCQLQHIAPGAYAVKTGIKVTKAIDVGGQPGAAAPSVEDTGLAVENPGAVLHDLRLGVAGETMARAFELRAGTVERVYAGIGPDSGSVTWRKNRK